MFLSVAVPAGRIVLATLDGQDSVYGRAGRGTVAAVSVRLATVLVLLPLAAAGCGSDSNDDSSGSGGASSPGTSSPESKTPQQILEESAAALQSVKTFHVEGEEGAGAKATSVKGDVGLPKQLRLELTHRGATATMIVVNGSLYVKANAAFWREEQGGKVAKEIADRWIKAPASTGELRSLTKQLDPATLSRCLLRGHGTLAHGGKAMVDGRQTLVIVDKGDRPGTAPGKLFVAATGEPLPLRTLATGNERPGGRKDPSCDSEDDSPTHAGDTATFSRYDEPLSISAPPAAIDVAGGSAS
jgi:hypothetical protein